MEESAKPAPPHAGCLICETAIPLLKSIFPEAAADHFRASRVEFLKGLRTLIDERIERLSKQETKGTKVVVENNRKNKGRVIIEYYSLDDLDRILAVMRK